MVSADLSRAVVVWTGFGSSSSPQRDDALLRREFGDERCAEIVPQVHAVEEAFYRSSANVTAQGLQAMGEQAAAEFRALDWELAEDAVQALAWCYTYDYR